MNHTHQSSTEPLKTIYIKMNNGQKNFIHVISFTLHARRPFQKIHPQNMLMSNEKHTSQSHVVMSNTQPPTTKNWLTNHPVDAEKNYTSPYPPGLDNYPTNTCFSCHLKKSCRLYSLNSKEKTDFPQKCSHVCRTVENGESLYHAGDACNFLYEIRSGFFKTLAITANGHEQIISFNMSGETIGIDGIESGIHHLNAVALTRSEVCISHKPFQQTPNLQKILSKEITRCHNMALLSHMPGEKRIIYFLSDLSRRLVNCGDCDTAFHLRMTREEIGLYLGLKTETVSRIFSKLHKLAYIKVEKRYIQLQNLESLLSLIKLAPP